MTLNILVTRPEPKARQLAEILRPQVKQVYSQPLFSYEKGNDWITFASQFPKTSKPIFIFVSQAAVQFAFTAQSLAQWPSDATYIAVGSSTKEALTAIGINQVVLPDLQNSEGVLALQILQQVDNQIIVILRGDGGRELIAKQLATRNAIVRYVEIYQRIWLTSNTDELSDQWQKQQINCIVVTSNKILERLWQIVEHQSEYWQQKCVWIVASDRSKILAESKGIKHVVNANGANNNAIVNALTTVKTLIN